MIIRYLLTGLAGTLALAQGAPESARSIPWQPAWELTLRGDRFTGLEDAPGTLDRTGAQLRLRWTVPWHGMELVAGTRSALGSDGNRFNAERFDQQPSNGTQLDLARAEWLGTAPAWFGRVRLGFQDNLLLATAGLWDRDLRFLGAAAAGGWRSPGGLVQEAGLRAEAGRVRHLLGGGMDLAGLQAVLKLDTGAWSWTAHAARWRLAWDPGPERLEALPGKTGRQRLDLDAWGAGTHWLGPVLVEASAMGARNPDTGETSAELQGSIGSLERPWRARLLATWQRLSATGTLYPVNGDDWWYFRAARGTRLALDLALPRRWVAGFAYMRQREDGASGLIVRRSLTFTKKF